MTANKNQASVDLLKNKTRSLVYPGQSLGALYAHNILKGMMNTSLERMALQQTFSNGVIFNLNPMDVFPAAVDQGIKIVLVDDYETVANLEISSEARARITSALERGLTVITPQRMVQIDDKETIAWWEIDHETGETIGIGENGLHPATFE